jgi:hypothetical protein
MGLFICCYISLYAKTSLNNQDTEALQIGLIFWILQVDEQKLIVLWKLLPPGRISYMLRSGRVFQSSAESALFLLFQGVVRLYFLVWWLTWSRPMSLLEEYSETWQELLESPFVVWGPKNLGRMASRACVVFAVTETTLMCTSHFAITRKFLIQKLGEPEFQTRIAKLCYFAIHKNRYSAKNEVKWQTFCICSVLVQIKHTEAFFTNYDIMQYLNSSQADLRVLH